MQNNDVPHNAVFVWNKRTKKQKCEFSWWREYRKMAKNEVMIDYIILQENFFFFQENELIPIVFGISESFAVQNLIIICFQPNP